MSQETFAAGGGDLWSFQKNENATGQYTDFAMFVDERTCNYLDFYNPERCMGERITETDGYTGESDNKNYRPANTLPVYKTTINFQTKGNYVLFSEDAELQGVKVSMEQNKDNPFGYYSYEVASGEYTKLNGPTTTKAKQQGWCLDSNEYMYLNLDGSLHPDVPRNPAILFTAPADGYYNVGISLYRPNPNSTVENPLYLRTRLVSKDAEGKLSCPKDKEMFSKQFGSVANGGQGGRAPIDLDFYVHLKAGDKISAEVEAYTSGRNASAGTKITRFTVASMLSDNEPITKDIAEAGDFFFDPYSAADLTVLKATLDSARIVNDMAKDALGEREGQYSQDLYEAFAKLLAQAEVYVANPGDLTQREADVFNNQLMASLSALVSSRIPFNVVLGDKTAIRIAGTEKYLVQKNKADGKGFWYAAFMSMDEIINPVGNGETSYRWIFEVKEHPDGGYNLTNENGLLTADGYVTAKGDPAKARLKFVTQNQGDSLVAICRLSDNLYWNSSFTWKSPYDRINTSSIPVYAFVLETLETNALPLGAVDNDSHYATFSSNEDVVFTSDVEVDAVVVDGSILNITPLTKGDYIVKTTINNVCDVVFNGYYVPANNGVLVKSANDRVSYYYPYKKDETITLPGNQLKAAPAEGGVFPAEEDYLYYKLAYNNYNEKKGLGFYWGAAAGGAFSVKAGTAYLAVPTPSGFAAKGFSFSGATTGIDATNGVEAEKVREIYTIAGQKVSKMSKPGLYVVNGKKTVIRK
ncbi:MAG: hypothetical protein PUE86_04715 [Prevotella sp.]|nr:hypothetical protein [Prevotella sp.]